MAGFFKLTASIKRLSHLKTSLNAWNVAFLSIAMKDPTVASFAAHRIQRFIARWWWLNLLSNTGAVLCDTGVKKKFPNHQTLSFNYALFGLRV